MSFFATLKNGLRYVEASLRQQSVTRSLPDICDELASLLIAGLTYEASLHHLLNHNRNRSTERFLRDSIVALEQGATLSDAWRPHVPSLLDMLLCAGESSGSVPKVLRQWGGFTRELQHARHKLVQVASYPSLLCLMTVGLLVFSGRVLLPMFSGMYQQLGLHTPVSVRDAKALLGFLPSLLLYMVVASVLTLVALWFIHRFYPSRWRKLRRRLPGSRLRELRFTYVFTLIVSLLVTAGIPITDALLMLSKMARTSLLRQTAQDIADRIFAGHNLVAAFVGDWDPLFPVLLDWAEQTGDLGGALDRTRTYTANMFHQRLQKLSRWLEPSLLLAMGVVVSLTLYVVFVPMYDAISMLSGRGASK